MILYIFLGFTHRWYYFHTYLNIKYLQLQYVYYFRRYFYFHISSWVTTENQVIRAIVSDLQSLFLCFAITKIVINYQGACKLCFTSSKAFTVHKSENLIYTTYFARPNRMGIKSWLGWFLLIIFLQRFTNNHIARCSCSDNSK